MSIRPTLFTCFVLSISKTAVQSSVQVSSQSYPMHRLRGHKYTKATLVHGSLLPLNIPSPLASAFVTDPSISNWANLANKSRHVPMISNLEIAS